jgi:PKD repeat protein
VKRRETRIWLVRGASVTAILVPLLLWLSGCWLFNVAPVAGFTISAQTGQAPLTVNFSAVASTDEDGVITDFEWSFGDGTSGTGRDVSRTYDTAGTYVVILRVTDDRGDSSTAQKTIYVLPGEPPGPTASFTVSPASGTSPLTVSFNASASTYENGTISWYEWDFGDGALGYGRTVVHTYFSSGSRTFTATLTVQGSDGKTATATGAISVTAAGGGGTPAGGAPSARFDVVNDDALGAAGSTGVAPFRALFDPEDTTVALGRALLQLIWAFGDASSTSTPNLVQQWHVYVTDEPSETFSVTLVAMDNEAATDSITKTVRVYNHQPVAGFEIANPLGGHTPDEPVDDGEAEHYANEAAAVAADRWDDDDEDDGVIMGDLQALGAAPPYAVNVFIRSRLTTDLDWFELDGSLDQDDLEMAEGVNAAPGSTKPVPDDFAATNDAFSYDPEGQSWADRGNPLLATDDYPDWFPNQGWGIQWIYVDWQDGGPEEQFDYREETDSTGWAAAHPLYDQAAVMMHTYIFDGGTDSKTITIRVVDFLGAEATFSRTIHFMEGTEAEDDIEED